MEAVMESQLVLINHLRELRTARHLSQKELAQMVGVSRQTINSIENTQYNPTAKLALLLCIALDCKFEDLFAFE
jgi:putative transcriptional regulator